jgi:hypothetical protein
MFSQCSKLLCCKSERGGFSSPKFYKNLITLLRVECHGDILIAALIQKKYATKQGSVRIENGAYPFYGEHAEVGFCNGFTFGADQTSEDPDVFLLWAGATFSRCHD